MKIISNIKFEARVFRGMEDSFGGHGVMVNGKQFAPVDFDEEPKGGWTDDFHLSVGDEVCSYSDSGATGFTAKVIEAHKAGIYGRGANYFDCVMEGTVSLPTRIFTEVLEQGASKPWLENSQAGFTVSMEGWEDWEIESSYLCEPTKAAQALSIIKERQQIVNDLFGEAKEGWVRPAMDYTTFCQLFPGKKDIPANNQMAGIWVVQDGFEVKQCSVTAPSHSEDFVWSLDEAAQDLIFRKTGHRVAILCQLEHKLGFYTKAEQYPLIDCNFVAVQKAATKTVKVGLRWHVAFKAMELLKD